jgi:alanine-glyoxylate transaminase/serine-glyoxylate transaminase/serine-pyruvate transaminase
MSSITASARLAPPKRLIYGPGPAMVDPRASEALSLPITGLRDPWFLSVISDIQKGLREVFGTENAKTFVIPGSGSAAMEAAVSNFVQPGTKLGVFAAGHFADRIALMGKRHGASVVRCDKAWGEVFTEADAAEFLERERPDVVAFVQAETSTGAYQSGRAIAPLARKLGALVLADCVTSLGAMPVELDAVGIDIAYSCAQKGLSCPSGLSPISISPKAWSVLEGRKEDTDTWYLDLRLLAKYYEPPNAYHHTPSPPLFYALHQGLAVVEEEGLRNRWERHRKAGLRLVAGLEKLGFTPIVADPGNRLWHLSTVLPPPGVDIAVLSERLMKNYGIEIAGGLGQFAGKILRIGVMGPLADDAAVDFLIDAIGASLAA